MMNVNRFVSGAAVPAGLLAAALLGLSACSGGSKGDPDNRGDFKVTLDGKDIEVPLRFTNVWVKRDGGWQMVAWEATRIPAK